MSLWTRMIVAGLAPLWAIATLASTSIPVSPQLVGGTALVLEVQEEAALYAHAHAESWAVRRLAAEHGLDLEAVHPGPGFLQLQPADGVSVAAVDVFMATWFWDHEPTDSLTYTLTPDRQDRLIERMSRSAQEAVVAAAQGEATLIQREPPDTIRVWLTL